MVMLYAMLWSLVMGWSWTWMVCAAHTSTTAPHRCGVDVDREFRSCWFGFRTFGRWDEFYSVLALHASFFPAAWVEETMRLFVIHKIRTEIVQRTWACGMRHVHRPLCQSDMPVDMPVPWNSIIAFVFRRLGWFSSTLFNAQPQQSMQTANAWRCQNRRRHKNHS